MQILKYFFFPDDIERDQYTKASSLARILLSIILLHRHIDLLIGSPLGYLDFNLLISAILSCLSLLFGFLSPISIFVLARIDSIILHPNLNTNIIYISFLSLFLSNCWMCYSIDSFLIKKFSIYRQFICFTNQITFNIRTIRTITLFLLGGVFFRGSFLHLFYDDWINGTAVLSILRTGYFNDFSGFFSDLDNSFFLIFSKISTYGMLAWEGFLWCMPGFKLLRRIVFWWGLVFFLSAIVLLNIEYSAFTSIIIWTLIYQPKAFLLKNKNREKEKSNFQIKTIKNKYYKSIIGFIKFWLKLGFLWSFFVFNFLAVLIKTVKDENINNALISFSENYFVLRIGHHVSYRIFGQSKVNVFNENIEQGRFNIIACRILNDGSKELVPFQDLKGGRLSYLSNDVFMNITTSFQRTTKRLNWGYSKDQEKINNSFKALAKDVSLFDFNVNKRDEKIDAYEVYLTELFPSYKDGYLNRWIFDKNHSIKRSIILDKTFLNNLEYKYRLNLPPGYFNNNNRIKNTLNYFCN